MSAQIHDVFFRSADGLRLHARDIAPASEGASGALPVLCLPGLTRTSADFDTLMLALANDETAPRRVVAVDYRGRGLSDFDPDIAHYSVPVEMADVLALASELGIGRAIVVGTSRGGLIALALAAAGSPLLAGVVLNDVGPVIERAGLMRIKGSVGERPVPSSWEDAAQDLKRLFGCDFPALTDAAWRNWARRAWREQDGMLRQTYDPALAQTLAALNADTPLPPAWDAFDALAASPLMLVHGALSDLLSRDTIEAMQSRRPDLEVFEVADQGHAPLLDDEATITRIKAFCARCDRAA
ncbi:alpha/beta fold hydrolase [Bradyrhizobium sp. WD16]|uniref:alpha/beta fold hydrolase n=1 Tax=Bradyrhizobium sp. WD16 TaxID=1521768 RepID=UPI0020A263FB|nr:alpha/beta hydrolase [Bradyrhizobium sp. WD16]UTD28821.1 alpha/beta hydrolase [Bradyrhizobium sp. WD16]